MGWDQNEEGDFTILWNNVNPAPDEVLDMMFCTCTKKCERGSCPCVDNSLKCTDACTKQNCENFQDFELDNDDFEDEDGFDEEINDEDTDYESEEESDENEDFDDVFI